VWYSKNLPALVFYMAASLAAFWVYCLSLAGIHQFPVYNYSAAGQDAYWAIIDVCPAYSQEQRAVFKACVVGITKQVNDSYLQQEGVVWQ
jgi:hypothetical protein